MEQRDFHSHLFRGNKTVHTVHYGSFPEMECYKTEQHHVGCDTSRAPTFAYCKRAVPGGAAWWCNHDLPSHVEMTDVLVKCVSYIRDRGPEIVELDTCHLRYALVKTAPFTTHIKPGPGLTFTARDAPAPTDHTIRPPNVSRELEPSAVLAIFIMFTAGILVGILFSLVGYRIVVHLRSRAPRAVPSMPPLPPVNRDAPPVARRTTHPAETQPRNTNCKCFPQSLCTRCRWTGDILARQPSCGENRGGVYQYS